MTTYRFRGPTAYRTERGQCPTCGKRVSRSATFEQTVNPFNRNPDGTVKTWAQVQSDVDREADQWVPEFEHEACRAQRELGASLTCPECGHEHAGAQLGQICIGCPCEHRPGAAGETSGAGAA